MFYSNQRIELRRLFFDTWNKYQAQTPLEPVEQQLLQVIVEHPEYHQILSQPDHYIDKDYRPELGETNPFLHMSLHLGIREQISTNRPSGITLIYQQLLSKYHGAHLEVEHIMMDILAEQIWEAQRNKTVPDEGKFMQQLHKLLMS